MILLREFLAEIEKLKAAYPEIVELPLIYDAYRDDMLYKFIEFEPTIGYFSQIDETYTHVDTISFDMKDCTINAVCIN